MNIEFDFLAASFFELILFQQQKIFRNFRARKLYHR